MNFCGGMTLSLPVKCSELEVQCVLPEKRVSSKQPCFQSPFHPEGGNLVSQILFLIVTIFKIIH